MLLPLFQGPLLLSFEEDPLWQPLGLEVHRVSSVARSAQEKVSWGVGACRGPLPAEGANVKPRWRGSGGGYWLLGLLKTWAP